MENIHEIGTFQLHNKVEIPQVGFGTWQMPDGETAADAVMHAIEAGYTHIDTAAVYHNEIGVGAGIRMSGVPREKLFVTSKLWNDVRGYEETLKAFDASEYGGAPLLGLKGLVVKSHGSAKSVEIRHAIFQCEQFKEEKINEKIEEFIAAEQKAQAEAKAEEK